MQLLAGVTGWSQDTLRVTIGYMREQWTVEQWTVAGAREYGKTWGYTVSTTVCGDDTVIHAEGRTLPEALFALAAAVCTHHKKFEDWHALHRREAEKRIATFAQGR